MIHRPYISAPARVREAKRISTHAKLANELGRKLRVSVTAARKPAILRSATR